MSAAIQEDDLDEYIVSLVARLGGLVVLRNLAQRLGIQRPRKGRAIPPGAPAAARAGPAHGRRNQLAGEGATFSACCCSATPDNRNFTPAELRLLLALGHQIGMAVENSYLIQQTSRRSEELHILNEIGRALSSTLDLDALLERIYSEMRRLLDVSSFFIAFYDHKTEEVRFEIEVVDGERLPKRYAARREIIWWNTWCARASRC